MAKQRLLFWILLFLIALWVVWPAFGTTGPAWMGSADGLMLARARFLSEDFGLGSLNRYWFLGIPGQQIGSPLLPWLLSLLTVLTGSDPVNQFGVWRGMVALGVVGTALGAFWFAELLFRDHVPVQTSTGKRSQQHQGLRDQAGVGALFVSLVFLLMPSVLVLFPQIWPVLSDYGWPSWTIFSPFYLGDGQQTIAFGLLFLLLVQTWKLIFHWNLKRATQLSLLISLLLLVDSPSFLTYLLWIGVFLLTVIIQPRKRKMSIIVLAVRLLVISFLGLLITSFWFTPGYIYTFLGSPSLGGQPFTVVLITLLRKLIIFLPMVLGIFAAKRWLKASSRMTIIGIVGLLVFGSITIASFFADTDFWQDYSRFGRSLDLSLAILVGGVFFTQVRLNRISQILLFIVVASFSMPFLSHRESLLQGSIQLRETAEYRVSDRISKLILDRCRSSAECSSRVYLSGSSTFWLNSWFDIAQVRGGGEMGSLNDWWPHGSYQIREGSSADLAQAWLEALGVDTLVVHNMTSSEPYHDFLFPSKFEAMPEWEKIWEEDGDSIYSIKDTGFSVARAADLSLEQLTSPAKGDDLVGLLRYTEALEQAMHFQWSGNREIVVSGDLSDKQGVRIAIAHSPFWRVSESNIPTEVDSDPLGMIFLRPLRSGDYTARLVFNPWPDVLAGVGMTALAFFVLFVKPAFIERTVSLIERFVGRESELDRSAL